MSHTYFLGLGSNLRQRARNIRHALGQVSKQIGRVEDTSYLYETPPMYTKDQPRFLNAVAKVSTDLTPHDLLQRLLAIEMQMGRVRPSMNGSSQQSAHRYGPRIIDLDILCGHPTSMVQGYSSRITGSIRVNDGEKLQIPHPRMLERNFVVSPLSDLMPDDMVRLSTKSERNTKLFDDTHAAKLTLIGAAGNKPNPKPKPKSGLFRWTRSNGKSDGTTDDAIMRQVTLRELSREFQMGSQPINQVTPLLYGTGMRGIGGSETIGRDDSEVLHRLSQGSFRNTALMAILNVTDDSFSKDGWISRSNSEMNDDEINDSEERVLASTLRNSNDDANLSVRERIERMMDQRHCSVSMDSSLQTTHFDSDPISSQLDYGLIRDCVSQWIDHSLQQNRMVQMVDVGGQSTRPGSRLLSAQEEMDRVCRVIEELRQCFPNLPISVDTFYPSVARECIVNCGASMVNDISFANPNAWCNIDDSLEEDMISVMAELNVPYILTHSIGRMNTPLISKENEYTFGLVNRIQQEMNERVSKLIQAGVYRWNIICDPGLGFNKTADECNVLIANMHRLKPEPKMPILSGPSRKSCLKSGLKRAFGDSESEINDTSNDSRKIATAAAVNESIMSGCDFVRVHDVEMMSIVRHTADEINSQRIRHDTAQSFAMNNSQEIGKQKEQTLLK